MRITFKKFLSFIFFLMIVQGAWNNPLFSMELLDNQNATWSTVLSGTTICPPALTSYGICLASDAKNLIAISSNGNILWEKSFSRSKNVTICSLPSDFILFFDNDKNLMKLINPSGSLVWEIKCPFKVTDTQKNVFSGRDGRFIIKNEAQIYCYGINGICRWSINSLELKKLPAQELPDGSIIFFTKEKDSKTCGLRISPYGNILEEITFSGEISNSWWCKDGVLLSFTDGSSGLFSLDNNLAKNKWVFNKKLPGISFVVGENKKVVCAILPAATSTAVHLINSGNGNSISNFVITDINGNDLQIARLCSSGLLIADSKNCYFYKTDGTLLRAAQFENQKSKSAWNYLCLTSDAYLILCRKNWTLDSFRLSQNAAYQLTEGSEKKKTSYPDFININTAIFDYLYDNFDSQMTDSNIISQLKKGSYEEKEITWTSNILSTAYAYCQSLNSSDFGVRIENTIFENDTAGLEEIIAQLPYLVTSDSAECIALLIRRCDNLSILNAVFKGLSECGYDPDGKILEALEFKAAKLDKKASSTIALLCDAVGNICVYMGKPAYFSKGRLILKRFMSVQYNSHTREHIRQVMQTLL